MTGAMYAAVSGLRAHMSALNVIGNNIANINTNAYKAARYVFSEELYTNVRAGSNGTLTSGGMNPAQIGYGTSVGAVDLDMSTKNYTPTGKPGDVTIDGDGFLLVGPKDLTFNTASDVKKLYLTRLGDLEFRADGYLCDHDGNVVYGWLEVQAEGDAAQTSDQGTYTSRVLTPIRLPMISNLGNAVFPTEENGLVNDRSAGESVSTGTGAGAQEETVLATSENSTEGKRALLSSLTITENGQITGITQESGQVITIGYIALGQVDNPNGVTHVSGRLYQALDGAGQLHVSTMGELASLPPDSKLDGDTAGGNGTEANNVIPIEMTKNTSLVPNGLESSGTELATEISNMIMMQRGYQANTRIITVTDSMLEELVNMKR